MRAPDSPAPADGDRLDTLPRGRAAVIARVAWETLQPNAARRMRELGFDEGVRVEKLHAGPLGQDPIAVRVGRMTIAIRRAQAAAVLVTFAPAAGAQADGAAYAPELAIAAE